MNAALGTPRILGIFGAAILFALPIPSEAEVNGVPSLVWGAGVEQIQIFDGGTYLVALNSQEPAYITAPFLNPDGEPVFSAVGNLYQMNGATREYLATLNEKAFDDPDDTGDGDTLFAWPASGQYELDIVELQVAPNFTDNRDLKDFLARFFALPVAEAQVEGTVLATIRFTISESGEDELDPVVIIPGILGSEQHNGEWIIDPILHTYDDLIATLDVNGYTPEEDLFTFPYNWRKSNVETALLLKEKIDAVKDICNCSKVDLVAHSMGGLVARQYIQSEDYDGDVDQLIFLGTPHLGAPKAYLMWEGGEYGPGLSSFLFVLLLSQEAREHGYPDLFSYVRGQPIEAVRELLAIYDYIFDDTNLRDYPDAYPVNIFLENLNADIPKLLNSGVEIHNIRSELGQKQTIFGVSVTTSQDLPKWEHGFPDVILGSGDGTVPTPSASFLPTDATLDVDHLSLVTAAQRTIVELLTGEAASVLINNFNFPNAKVLIFKMFSPADFLITAPDGKRIGRNTNDEINEIKNAFYTGFATDIEYITILNPLDGEYKIASQGTGSGPYTVEVAYISEENTASDSFTGMTKLGLTTELTYEYDAENPVESNLLPTDTTSPAIVITAPLSRDYLRSEALFVNVSSTDAESGLATLQTSLDGAIVPNFSSHDLFLRSLGIHSVIASSTDNVGNATSSTRTFRLVTTVDSTAQDIERLSRLGWMSKATSISLSAQLKVAVKIVKKSPPHIDKLVLLAMVKQLDYLRGRGLNDQAYRILKEDLQWLISN